MYDPERSCSTDLGEHGFAVVRDHHGLVTVQRDGRIVEGLLGVLQNVVQVCYTPLEDRPEVAGNQRPPDRCRDKIGCYLEAISKHVYQLLWWLHTGKMGMV